MELRSSYLLSNLLMIATLKHNTWQFLALNYGIPDCLILFIYAPVMELNDPCYWNLFFPSQPTVKEEFQCRCGWEDKIGRGVQRGFVGVVKAKEGYGFITRVFPRERNPTGIYFHKSELKEMSIMQIKIGDRVCFLVGQNDKGCIAQHICLLVPQVTHVETFVVGMWSI